MICTTVKTTWITTVDGFRSQDNLFVATVIGNQASVSYGGKSMTWQPDLIIDGKTMAVPTATAINDPLNSNYGHNTLSWQYSKEITRYLRQIEGVLMDYYVFASAPAGDVVIRDNTVKTNGFNYDTSAYAVDADYKHIPITDTNGSKTVKLSDLKDVKYPIIIDPTNSYVTSASDAFLAFQGAQGVSYDNVRASGTSNTLYNATTEANVGQSNNGGAPTSYTVARSAFFFNTTDLPDNAVVTGGNFSLYSTGTSYNMGADDGVQIVNGAPDYPSIPVVSSDYNATLYSGNGGSMLRNYSAGYHNLTLSADGCSWVNTTAITRFVLRSLDDIAGITPGSINEILPIYYYEKGTGYWPLLYITYVIPVVPTVTSNAAATNVENTTMSVGGNLTDDGGIACTKIGVVFSSSNSTPIVGGTGCSTSEASGTYNDPQAIDTNLTSLTAGATYYWRAYSYNTEGYGYGDIRTTILKPGVPVSVTATDGTSSTNVTVAWTASLGATNYTVYRNTTEIGWIGNVTSYVDTGAGAPTITPGTASSSDGTSSTFATLSLAGEGTTAGTLHSYTVKAKNDSGNSTVSDANTGYRGTATLYGIWQRSAGDSDATYSEIAGASADPYNDSAAPSPTITSGAVVASDGTSSLNTTLSLSGSSVADGTGRYFKCTLYMLGASNQTSVVDRGYRGATALTYQWNRSSGDADSGYGALGGATSSTYNDTGAPAPLITTGSSVATDGTSTANVGLSLSGSSVADGAGRYYTCTLTSTGAGNSPATATANRGYRGATALTYQWNRSSGDADSGYGTIAGANASTYNDAAAPAPTITTGTPAATDGTSTANVALSISGESANVGAGRYYTCTLVSTGASNTPANVTANRGYIGVGSLSYQWMKSAANSDAAYSNIGGATADPYNDTAAPEPTVTPGAASATDGTSSSYVTLSNAGETGVNGDTRYYLCTLTATGATTANTTYNTGYRGTTSVTYAWQRSAGDSDAAYSAIASGTTDPYNDSAAPADGSGRYFKAVISMANAASTNSTADRGYRASAPTAPTNVVATDGTSTSNVTITWTASAGATDYYVFRNTTELGAVGNVTLYYDTGAAAGTITAGTITATDGTSTSETTLNNAGESVSNGATYVYKVKAKNAVGNSTDSDTNTGYRGVGSLTYQWMKSSGDSDATYSVIGGATTDPYSDTAAPAPTITTGTPSATDGSSTANITLNIAGESSNVGAGRYYISSLSATGATSVNVTANRGYRGVGSLTYQWMRSSGDSDATYSDIGGATTEPYNDVAAPAPTVTPGAAAATDGTSALVALSVSGESSTNGAGRYFLCKLTATGASNANTTADRGYLGTATLGYQWYKSAADSDAAYSVIAGATTDPYNDSAAPTDGAGRYYLATISMSNAASANTTANRGYRSVDLVTVTTQAASSIANTTATLNGNITNIPAVNATQRGFAWGTVYNITLPSSNQAPPATYASSNITTGNYGVGTFTYAATGLSPGTTYYYRSAANNTGGWAWGDQVSFLTKPAAPTNVAATDGTYTTKVTVTWTKSTSATGYKVYEGANLLDTLGDVATYDDSAAPAPSVTPGTTSATDGASSSYVTLAVTGQTGVNGSARTYKVVAFNAVGDSSDSATDTGYRGTTTLTFSWLRSATDSDSSYSSTGGTTNPYNDTAAPADGSGRYFKATVSMVGAANANTTSDRGYRLLLVVVSTSSATSVTNSTAIIGGTVVSMGNGNITSYGIQYGPATTYGSWINTTELKTTTFNFGNTSTSLTPGNVYYYRAFANDNINGIAYGSQLSFLALPNAPTAMYSSPLDAHTVTLIWTRGAGATNTVIWNNTTQPTGTPPAISGTVVYNSTSWGTTVSGLVQGTTYYFTGYSWTSNATLSAYSSGNTTASGSSALTPSNITTSSATEIAATSAKLNSVITWDGWQPCDVRFGYDTVSRASVNDYTFKTDWDNDAYSTGSTPFAYIYGLNPGTTYYFRAVSRNDIATNDATNELIFTPALVINPPLPFTGTPSPTTILLSWIRGAGSTTTYIRYATGGYPTATSDGTLVANSTESYYILSGLVPGTTYFFRAWGYSGGTFSPTSTTSIVTTAAGVVTPATPALNYTAPSTMYQNTTATGFATNPLAGIVENNADAYSMPETSVWIILALLLSVALGIWIYSASSNIILSLFAIGAGIAFSVLMGLLPLWILIVFIVLGLALVMVNSRYGS
jgi:hypothetical protein